MNAPLKGRWRNRLMGRLLGSRGDFQQAQGPGGHWACVFENFLVRPMAKASSFSCWIGCDDDLNQG